MPQWRPTYPGLWLLAAASVMGAVWFFHTPAGITANENQPAGAQTLTIQGVEIIGSDAFKSQVTKALGLLQEQVPEAEKIVTQYVGRIQQGLHSGMWAYSDPPTFVMADPTTFNSVTWCAGAIAHDSFHSKLYHDSLLSGYRHHITRFQA